MSNGKLRGVVATSAKLGLVVLSWIAGSSGVFAQEKSSGANTFLTIRMDDEKQTIHSFGASDCWTTKFIGQWRNAQKKEQIADLLFSMDTTSDGSPKGIGLSLWRFNIGSGSYEQGDLSNIPDEWRREECFLNEDGTYNWKKQKGAQWFLNAAKKRGVKYTLGFSIAPPVFMAKNGKAYNGTGNPGMNIKEDKMDAYADFMSAAVRHFKFDYLSPVNEPQWFWGKDRISQEGTQATNDEIALLAKLLSKKLSAQRSKTKVVIGEAGQWDFLYGNNTDNRGDQINQFFAPSSLNYIGGLPNIARIISGHSYFTTCPDTNMVNIRRQVAEKINQVDPSLETWQTEFGILGNICNQYKGGPRNTGIDYGLYVAKVIHHDLVIANVSSWQWWLAISPYNYSDALVYINAPSGTINIDSCKQDGIVSDSRQLWAFGNFARFIRPGMKRITAAIEGTDKRDTASGSLMVSAYKDEINRKLVLVVVNLGNTESSLQLKGTSIQDNIMNTYTTTASFNLNKSVVSADHIRIAPKSVITLTGTYQ